MRKIGKIILSSLVIMTMLSGISFAETTDSLLEAAGVPQFNDVVAPVEVEGQEGDLSFFGDIVNSPEQFAEEEVVAGSSPEDETINGGEAGITPFAAAPRLVSAAITDIWLGKDADKGEIDVKDNWESLYYNDVGASSISGSIDATGYDYIRFRVKRMGYSTSSSKLMDGVTFVRTYFDKYLDANGNECPIGGIAYGFSEDFVYAIPHGSATSHARFNYVDMGVPVIEREANVYITWATPTAPAPTTPRIVYDAHAEDATVLDIDATMEYRVKYNDGSVTLWTGVAGTGMYVPIYDEPYTLQIRYKTAPNGFPSLNCEINVKTRANFPAEYVGYWSVDEILGIFESGKQVQVALGDNTGFFSVSPGYYTLESFIDAVPTGGLNRVYIRHAATQDTPASYAGYFTLYGRNPNTPTAVYYSNGMLYNLTPNVVYSFNGSSWANTNFSQLNVTSFMSTSSTTLLELKYMPTANTSCSNIRQIVLPKL